MCHIGQEDTDYIERRLFPLITDFRQIACLKQST